MLLMYFILQFTVLVLHTEVHFAACNYDARLVKRETRQLVVLRLQQLCQLEALLEVDPSFNLFAMC